MKPLISIVAPMYNEESLIFQYCTEMIDTFEAISNKYNIELILVNDGSTDSSLIKATQIYEAHKDKITLVNLSRNFGLEGAIKAGLQVSSGDAVIVMDADLQDPPSIALKMVSEWEKGFDIVTGSRKSRPSDTFFKRFTAKLFYKTLGSLSGKLKLEPEAANFRLLNRSAVNKLLSLPESNSVFRVLVPYLGMNTTVVSYERDKRFAGETKYTLSSMVRYALDSITGISIEPLRKIFYIFIFSAITSFISVVSIFLVDRSLIPILVLSSIISIFFSCIFLAISVMAEYIGQIYIETKARPTSLVYEVKKSLSAKKGVE